MVTIVYPALFAVVGALVYALTTNTKLTEIGRITLAVGLFWLLAILSRTSFHF